MSVNEALNITLTISIISFLITLIGIFLIARWIYFDAKSRGTNPLPWIVMTVIIFPNFIGLIMYILARPKSDMLCNNCNFNISRDMNFCPNCGEKTVENASFSTSKISNKSLIWGIILFVLFAILTFIGAKIHSILPERNRPYKASAFNLSSESFGNQWKDEFKILDGTTDYFFEAESENPVLVYSSEITMGNITFEVYSSNDSIIKIPSPHHPINKILEMGNDSLIQIISSNTSGEISNLIQGKTYKVIATTDGIASGKYSFEMK